MGKWCAVKCNCPNRIRQHLSNSWEGNYLCGHRYGELFGGWPGNLFEIGRVLKSIFKHEPAYLHQFEIFLRISDVNNYEDEYLALTSEQRDWWQLELEELAAFQKGLRYFPFQPAQKWQHHWSTFFSDPWHQESAKSVEKILNHGFSLCDASVKTGDPIEFYL